MLSYEIWFKFIGRVERIFIRNEKCHEQIGELADHIAALARDTIIEIEDVIHTHPQIFTKNTSTIKKAFSVFVNYIFDVISKLRATSMYVAFPRIVTAISNSLHNLLFILHEVEHLADTDKAFISFTDEVDEIIFTMGVCPMTFRANMYNEVFGKKVFTIKNYSSKPINESCSDSFAKFGISTCEDSCNSCPIQASCPMSRKFMDTLKTVTK